MPMILKKYRQNNRFFHRDVRAASVRMAEYLEAKHVLAVPIK